MQEFKTEVEGKKISCTALGVIEGERLRGRVSLIFAKALHRATGQTLSDVFRDGINIDGNEGDNTNNAEDDANWIIELANRGAAFRMGIDWEELLVLIGYCCGMCTLTTTNVNTGKPFTEKLNIEDLEFQKEEHIKIFYWFLECQLGNFTAWKRAKSFGKKYFQELINDAMKKYAV